MRDVAVTNQAGGPRWNLGEQLRVLRNQRGLSLADVAKATGISKSFLSLVESGKSDITIRRLWLLVQFYGTTIAELMPVPTPSSPSVVRREDAREIDSPSEGIDLFLLAPDTNRAMMPLLQFVAPNGASAGEFQHDGEEFLHVVGGTIVFHLEGAEFTLNRGDTIYFDGDQSHSFRNVGSETAHLITVVTPPTL